MELAFSISSASLVATIVLMLLLIKAISRCDELESRLHKAENQAKLDRKCVEALASIHERYCPKYMSFGEVPPMYRHRQDGAQSESVDNITLDELAKLVLDGTPIKRDVPESKEYGIHKTK